MVRIELTPQQKRAISDVWDRAYSATFDPPIQYNLEAVHAPHGKRVHDLLKALRGPHIFFSVLSNNRKAVVEAVQNGSFPANQFCAITPRIALSFTRGHRAFPRAGDPAPICVIKDPGASNVGSPSVIQKGKSDQSQLSSSHHTTSNQVELIAVVQARVVGQMALSGVQKKRKQKHNLLGEEVDETTKRKMRKIRRKRMDNFGVKEDF